MYPINAEGASSKVSTVDYSSILMAMAIMFF
jgi:hypothetical protein